MVTPDSVVEDGPVTAIPGRILPSVVDNSTTALLEVNVATAVALWLTTKIFLVYVKPVGVPAVVVIAEPPNDDDNVNVVEPFVAMI